MRKLYLCLTGALLLFIATAAEAAIQRLDPVDGYDCASDMSTNNCFGPTATPGGLYITACKAEGRQNQRCRDCMEAYDSSGESMGYNTCNYVRRDAACSCFWTDTDCRGTSGSCNYYW